jgi:hypothetical protein
MLDRLSGALRPALSAKLLLPGVVSEPRPEDGVGEVWQLKRRGDHYRPSCGSTAPIHHKKSTTKTPNSGSANTSWADPWTPKEGTCQEAEKGTARRIAGAQFKDMIEWRQTLDVVGGDGAIQPPNDIDEALCT